MNSGVCRESHAVIAPARIWCFADAGGRVPREAPISVSPAPQSLTERAKGLALAVGFDLAGVSRALPTAETEYLRQWLARGLSLQP